MGFEGISYGLRSGPFPLPLYTGSLQEGAPQKKILKRSRKILHGLSSATPIFLSAAYLATPGPSQW